MANGVDRLVFQVTPAGLSLVGGSGHALADAAEPLLLQAISREALAQERDKFALEARTDRLTGLENRSGWDHLLDNEENRRARYPAREDRF
jgi:hypothetical protein